MQSQHAGSYPDPSNTPPLIGAGALSTDLSSLLHLVVPKRDAWNVPVSNKQNHPSTDEKQRFQKATSECRRLLSKEADPTGIVKKFLHYALAQLRSASEVETLRDLLNTQPVNQTGMLTRILAVCQFRSAALELSPVHTEIIASYAKVLEQLLTNENGTQLSVHRGLFNQWFRYFEKPPTWARYLPLLAELYADEARRAGPQTVALDLLSASEDLVKACASHPFLWTTYSKIESALESYKKLGVELPVALHAYLQLFDAWDRLVGSVEQQHDETKQFIDRYISIPSDNPIGLEVVARNIQNLIHSGPTYTAVHLYQELVLTCRRDGNDQFLPAATALFTSLVQAKLAHHQEEQLLTLVKRGQLRTPEEISDALKKWRTLRLLEDISNREPLTKSDLGLILSEKSEKTGEILSPDIIRKRLGFWEELDDIRRGFTARLGASRRTPFREAPDLVQFARDVGGERPVRYLNSRDSNLFPGRGFLITRIDKSKTFKSTPPTEGTERISKKPYEIYKKAWPMLAEAIDDIDKAEFVFLRGFIVISCKSLKYTLDLGSGVKTQYSLVVFNDHFFNPFQEVAYLVPSKALAQLLLRTQIPDDDYVGFDARRADLNAIFTSPQAMMNLPGIKDHSIDVGSVSTILSGFSPFLRSNGLNLQLESLKSTEELLQSDLEKFNVALKSWRQHDLRYQRSEIGRREMRELEQQRAPLAERHEVLMRARAELFTKGEGQIWQLVSRLVALHKVLSIQHSYWHRGYTDGKVIQTHHISDTGDPFDTDNSGGPLTAEQKIELAQEGEVTATPNSLRMLVQAYEFHSRQREPNPDPNDFLVLVPCNALKTGEQPSTDVYLDTWDMTAHIKGKTIQLSRDKMTADDEIFWLSTFFPYAQDRPNFINDLRFYPRSTLKLRRGKI